MNACALDPFSRKPRWVPMPAHLGIVRWPEPPRHSLASLLAYADSPFCEERSRYVDLPGQLYRSEIVAWEGIIYAEHQEEALALMQCAEFVTLAFVSLTRGATP